MKCWFCDRKLMREALDLGIGWFRCEGCGATWTELPKPGASPLGGIWRDGFGNPHYHSVNVRGRRQGSDTTNSNVS